MKFSDLDKRGVELFTEHHEVKFYEMILCFAAEELFEEDIDEIELTNYQFNKLLNCMTCYLADDYHVSPWHVADALVALVKKHGADTVITDCNDGGKLLETELYKLESGSYEGE